MQTYPETLPLQLADRATNAVTLFPSVGAKAVVVIFPALGVKASYYRHYAQVLAQQGIHVATFDHRGHGLSSVRASRKHNFGYKEQIETEYEQAITAIRNCFTGCRVFIMGHSLGGQIGSMFAARYSHLVDGLILNASCSIYYKGWPGIMGPGIWVTANFFHSVAQVLGYFPGKQLNFGATEARGIIADWHHTALSNSFAAKGSTYDYNHAMQQCKLPVLAFTYQGDLSAPPTAMQQLTRKFENATSIQAHHIQHPQAPAKKYNHYSWIKEPQLSIPIVMQWLKANGV